MRQCFYHRRLMAVAIVGLAHYVSDRAIPGLELALYNIAPCPKRTGID
jgi:hypothetical protein